MAEKWIEKYTQQQSGSPKQSEKKDDFDLFYELSEVDHVPVDTNAAWDSIIQKLSPKKSISISWGLRIAASVIIALGIAFTVYQVQQSPETIKYVSEYSDSEQRTINLPDGSIVTLAKNSSVDYPNENFLQNRKVKFEGEGFFEITKSDKPFSVKTPEATIEVLGTSFGVDTRNDTRVVVEDGTVALKTQKEALKLTQGKSALASKTDGKIKLIPTDPNALSWKTGKFTFSDTELSDAFNYLSKYYNVNFSADQALQSCRITVKFNKESLSSVVDVLATILNAQSQISDKEVQFSGKGCN